MVCLRDLTFFSGSCMFSFFSISFGKSTFFFFCWFSCLYYLNAIVLGPRNRTTHATTSCATGHTKVVRVTGMIQDLGELEYIPLPGGSSSSSYVERQPVLVVTDWQDWRDDDEQKDDNNKNNKNMAHREKRRRLEESKPLPSTTSSSFLMYVYYPNDRRHSESSSSLQLHQLIEWIAVREEPDHKQQRQQQQEGDTTMMDDRNDSSLRHAYSQGSDDSSSFWGNSHASLSLFPATAVQSDSDKDDVDKMPRLHALFYCSRTLDELFLKQQQQPIILAPHDAVAMLASALQVPLPAAKVVWWTLLSRAEPGGRSLGCASLQIVVSPHVAAQWQAALTQILSQLVPAWHTWTVPPSRRLAQRHGRIRRHAWQLPAGTTVLVNNTAAPHSSSSATTTADVWSNIVQEFAIPLVCEGCQQVALPADWRFLVLSTPATQHVYTSSCTATLDWTQCVPPPPPQNNPVPSIGSLASTLATQRVAVPTVALPQPLLEQAAHEFCTLRQQQSSSSQRHPTQADLHRWLTWTRLSARSRGATTATDADWQQVMQIDRELSLL